MQHIVLIRNVDKNPNVDIAKLLDAAMSQHSLKSIECLTPLFPVLFEESQEKIAVYNIDGQGVYLNPAFRQIQTQETASKDAPLPRPAWRQLTETIHHVIQNRTPSSFQLAIHLPHMNNIALIEWVLSPMLNTADTLIGVLCIGRDLDYNKQVEIERGLKRESYQRALLDTFPFMVWLKNCEGQFVVTNREFARIAGVHDGQALEGKTDFDVFPAPMAQGYVDDDAKVISTGQTLYVKEKIQKSDGSYYWSETCRSPLIHEGNVIGTAGLARDISEQISLHAELERQHQAFSSLMQHIPIGVVTYDTQCSRTYINPYFERITGLKSEDLLGKKPSELICDHHLPANGIEFETKIREVMQSGISADFEVHREQNTGVEVQQITIIPRYDETGQTIGAYGITHDITELTQSQERIRFLAYHDPLTSLHNRLAFVEMLESLLSQTQPTPMAVMLMDLDHFKAINDTMGHAVGDQLLKQVALRVEEFTSATVFAARLGGDEFAIIYQRPLHQNEVIEFCQKILNRIVERYDIDGNEYFISASIGIAFYPDHSIDQHDLLRFSDAAMYVAKKQGRNQAYIYNKTLTDCIERRLTIENELRRAMERQELYLEFQPIVEFQTGRIKGIESLCRWENKKLGHVLPQDFIPVAEETGLIIKLGYWIMEEAFLAAYQINQTRPSPIPVSVNISARQLMDVDLIDTVKTLLHSAHCQAHWIKFEITESLLLENSERVMRILQEFNTLGIKISLDDFGTGQSALSYLSKFPIHQVKIDRSFIKEITHNQHDATLVKAIIAMANALNKELVAEGVEHIGQAMMLSDYECHMTQGFLHSIPVSLNKIDRLIQELDSNTVA